MGLLPFAWWLRRKEMHWSLQVIDAILDLVFLGVLAYITVH